MHVIDGWPYRVVIAVGLIMWALLRRRKSHASSEVRLSSGSTTERSINETNSARGPLVLVAETVPEPSPTRAETEQDQVEARCSSLEAELADKITQINCLRARLNGKDTKIGRLQLQLMESPTREMLESRLEIRDAEINSLEQQLEAERIVYTITLKAHLETVERGERRDTSYASTIADLKKHIQRQHRSKPRSAPNKYTATQIPLQCQTKRNKPESQAGPHDEDANTPEVRSTRGSDHPTSNVSCRVGGASAGARAGPKEHL